MCSDDDDDDHYVHGLLYMYDRYICMYTCEMRRDVAFASDMQSECAIDGQTVARQCPMFVC